MSFTTCRTLARRTLSSVSSSGIGTAPDAIFPLSRASNFSRSSSPIHTPTRRAPDRLTSFFARSTLASTTTTFLAGATPSSVSALSAAFAAVSNTPSFDNPYRPLGSISKNSSLCSNRSNVAPSTMRSRSVGLTKRESSATSRFTNVVFPVPSGPLTSNTVVNPSSSAFMAASNAATSTPRFFASWAIRTAMPALPGIMSVALSDTTGASWLTNSGTRYVKNPIMAAANCSEETVLKIPGLSTGLASPLIVFFSATPTNTKAGKTNRKLDTFDPSFASALPTVSVLIPRKNR
mmetsp:Transcript_35795/g.75379  ORF Transcript_35795/g.75379 Transcript_35795/m.75379 type:complete len:292 (+) Transcript_35795:411-1286(+)